jgi:hypothetical protein
LRLSPLLERKHRALLTIAGAIAPLAELKLPGVRIKGTTNGSQGVTLAGRRFRRGKQAGLRSLGHNAALALKLRELLGQHGALVVRLVRVAPNRLDGDNLEASFKRTRDGLAKCVGVDDRHPSVEYVVDDERGAVREYAVRFEVFPLPGGVHKPPDLGPWPPGSEARALSVGPTQISASVVDWSTKAKPNVRRPR